MRCVWLVVVALSGLVACGAELEGSGDDGDAADTSADLDTSEPVDVETDTTDTTDPTDTVESDTHDTREEVDTVEEVEEVDDSEVLDTTDDVDTSEDVEADTDDTSDTLEDLWDASDIDTPDTLEDLADGDLSDAVDDLSDTSPETYDDIAEDTSDVADGDTTEPIDTVDNPCLFPSGLHPDRYRPMAELRGAELRAALRSFVSEGTVGFDYDAARDLMYGITDAIDVDADLTIECVYTGYRRLADGTRSPGSGLTEITTEHSWPRSDGAAVFPAEGDIHHLFPALAPANNNRGNDEFGDVACGVGWPRSCAWADGGSFLGPAIDGRSSVFQVRPEHRGDIARAHFYFAVRYNRPIPALEEATLRRWHCQDPPSPRERTRNDRIEVHQKNRNPFVDQPFWVERILDY